ncbi:hypothetical protein CGLO_00265 [Colletotrichum gloeosporioides Cg-14]|nr:hypothetical protein CGLO_00265 [Colletotrichum gloeosporioides Cg-14]
MKRKGL